jgi:hypothetical protein
MGGRSMGRESGGDTSPRLILSGLGSARYFCRCDRGTQPSEGARHNGGRVRGEAANGTLQHATCIGQLATVLWCPLTEGLKITESNARAFSLQPSGRHTADILKPVPSTAHCYSSGANLIKHTSVMPRMGSGFAGGTCSNQALEAKALSSGCAKADLRAANILQR